MAKRVLTGLGVSISEALRAAPFAKTIQKVWIYEENRLVVDVVSSGINFAIDIIPDGDESFAVDRVQRKMRRSVFRINANTRRKQSISSGLPAEGILPFVSDLIKTTLEQIEARVTQSERSEQNTIERPLRIGVLTLPLNENYGGNLQAFALMKVLEQMGHAPALLNRRFKWERGNQPSRVQDGTRPLFPNSIFLRDGVKNTSFIESQILPITQPYFDSADLKADIDKYRFDAVIVGSDQVWRAKYAKKLYSDFFLEFLNAATHPVKRISYAASFGADDIGFKPKQIGAIRALLSKFDAVSVREDRGVALCETHFGLRPHHVLDPTLLLNADVYADLLPAQDKAPRKRVMTYVLDMDTDKAAAIQKLAAHLSLNPETIDGQDFTRSQDQDVFSTTVEDWVASFYNSEFAVTDSFHGVAFSILFNKPFLAYANPNRGAARFTSILKVFGLQDRLIFNSDQLDIEQIAQPIDWTRVNSVLEKERASSFAYLRSALRVQGSETPKVSAKPEIDAKTPPVVQFSNQPLMRDTRQENPLGTFCTGCGACASHSSDGLNMGWSAEGFLVPKSAGAPLPPDAIKVCPFNPDPEPDVRDEDALVQQFLPEAQNTNPATGSYIGAYIGYSEQFRKSSSSGGLGTFVFDQLLKRGDVQHIFTVTGDETGGYGYEWFTATDQMKKVSKTRYFPVTLERLFAEIDSKEGEVAVSGVACFIKAIRLKQHYDPALKEKIPFLIGLVCGGLKSRDYTDFLAHSAGIDGAYFSPDYRKKNPKRRASDYSFTAKDSKGDTHEIRMKKLGDMWGTGLFKSKACDFCTDVMTELADLSLGDAWLPGYNRDGRGNSIVITRSALAEEIILQGMQDETLKLSSVPVSKVARSQSGGFNHKHKAVSFRRTWLEQSADAKLPVLRDRLAQPSTVSEMFVHALRERTRAKSHLYWQLEKDATRFQKRMSASLRLLKLASDARQEDAVMQSTALQAISGLTAPENNTELVAAQILYRWLRKMATQRPGAFAQLLRIVPEAGKSEIIARTA